VETRNGHNGWCLRGIYSSENLEKTTYPCTNMYQLSIQHGDAINGGANPKSIASSHL
jgi:hypothetical protein